MGELEDYYVILSLVEYDNDPFKFGRIKCSIPGVIHSDTTKEEAMPWIRPFKMYGYQTFSRPLVGQKVWVLVSKTNYNEFWWFPFHETTDIVQSYLDEHYDSQPDLFNAREFADTFAMFTFDTDDGYKMIIGEDYINLTTGHEATMACEDARLMIRGGKTYCGNGDDIGGYEPCVMGYKCKNLRSKLSQDLAVLKSAADGSPYTAHLSPAIDKLKSDITADILGTNNYLN